MEFKRISGKIISEKKIDIVIEQILRLREQGCSQQEVSDKLNVDRTFISRLEKMGEVRKGHSIAVIGFPVFNKQELIDLLNKYGIDFHLIMTETERWGFVKNRSGIELLNEVTTILAKLKTFDTIIAIGSNERIKIFEALFGQQVLGVGIGESPIEEDKAVDLEKLAKILDTLKS